MGGSVKVGGWVWVVVGWLCVGSLVVLGVDDGGSGGFRYVTNYRPEDYNFSPQNWCVLQDRRGVMYIGNNAGLMEFDGTSWEAIEIPNYTVRSMALDESGTIFIGGNGEIGFLVPGDDGSLQYASLLDRVHEGKRNFNNVWKSLATAEGIYFFTHYYLFRWNPRTKQMRVWEPQPDHRFNESFTCNGTFYAHQRGGGLMQVKNNKLRLIGGEETFASVKMYMMAPYDGHRVLIGTRDKGFYLYDGSKAVPFATEADEYIKQNQLCHGIQLLRSAGQFALATRRGGLVIIDSRGRLRHIFNISAGLPVNNVKYVFEDFQGNLWLALVKGIAKIEYVSPFSFYDERSNLPELVLSVVRHGDALYAGTTNGLYVLARLSAGSFKPVAEIRTNCWSLVSTTDSVLAATSHGVFRVDGETNRVNRVIDMAAKFLYPSPNDPRRIWVGLGAGLTSLYLSPDRGDRDRWLPEPRYEGIKDSIITIAEDNRGDLWLGTLTAGVLRVERGAANRVTRYDRFLHLTLSEVHVFRAAGRVIFATRRGLFRFDEKSGGFFPETSLGTAFAGGEEGSGVFRMAEDQYKDIWFHSELRNFQAAANRDGTYTVNGRAFGRLSDSQVNTIYPDPGGNIIWLAGNNGLIRCDKGLKKDYRQKFSTVIREVEVNGEPRLYNPGGSALPVFSYGDRNLRFHFAALFFEAESRTQYRHLLQGYDEDWSDRHLEAHTDYTNLSAGTYTFKVQATNVYGNTGQEAVFRFRVRPPWYGAWWAYVVYGLVGLFMVFLVVRWRSGKLAREKKRLEQVVRERTVQLAAQSEKLREMDRVKSRFFANISHEFRTPLTLLIGPLEQMIAECGEEEGEKKRKLTMMLRNAQRLLRLINQLLELSRLDSGKMRLQAVKTDLTAFVRGIGDSFRLLARQKELELVVQAGGENDAAEMMLYIDPRKMEDVLSNLLINGLKFTPPGGKIKVTIKRKATAGEYFPEGWLEITVADTGPGIPPQQLAHVFERFYQAEAGYETHLKGSGIGLALAKELVELHRGKIEVRSREGEGTTFTIRLPSGSRHLPAEEIVDLPADIPEPERVGEAGEEEAAADEADRESEPAAGGKEIVLVVEDSADMRAYIREALVPDYKVLEAADGREGIDTARQVIPDLIVSDIMMPEVDGYELCRVLKHDVRTSHIPIILLTARAAEENILQGLESGADDYVTKPFNTKIVLARIKNLIELRRQLQANINRQMNLEPVKTSLTGIDREFFRELNDLIEKNLADEEFGVEQLSKRLYMGRTTLYRKIQALTGLTPTEFIRSYRLKRGAELLKQDSGTVLEVALRVGFSNSSYFARCFKEKFHQLPSQYQAAYKQ